MRGKLAVCVRINAADRITPADAGKTVLRMNARPKFQDHPRGCGENSVTLYQYSFATGITPADAGKTY